MLTLVVGFVLGVVACGLGVVTLPKLKALVAALKAKFSKKDDVVVPQVTVPTSTPVVEVAPSAPTDSAV